MSNATDKIKQAWNENPIGVAMVAAALLTATGKLIDAVSSIQGRRAYAQQVKHKTKGKK